MLAVAVVAGLVACTARASDEAQTKNADATSALARPPRAAARSQCGNPCASVQDCIPGCSCQYNGRGRGWLCSEEARLSRAAAALPRGSLLPAMKTVASKKASQCYGDCSSCSAGCYCEWSPDRGSRCLENAGQCGNTCSGDPDCAQGCSCQYGGKTQGWTCQMA